MIKTLLYGVSGVILGFLLGLILTVIVLSLAGFEGSVNSVVAMMILFFSIIVGFICGTIKGLRKSQDS